MIEILPFHVREWVLDMQRSGVRPPSVREAKVMLDAILTTALNDQVVLLHAGRGVKTPPVAHASWLLARGVDLQTVRQRLGHGSIVTTGKYLHALPGADQAAIRTFDAFRERNPTTATAAEDPRDAELAELRELAAQLREFLGGNGAVRT